MSTHHQRLRFLEWMVGLGLDAETADAILMGMSPFDWHELSTKKDLEPFATKTDLENLRLATKADIENLRLATKADIDNLRLATKTDIENLRLATQADIENLRVTTAADIENLRVTTAADIVELRSEMATKGELRSFGTELRSEMHDGFAQLRRQMDGLRRDVRLTLFAVMGFMLSVLLAAGGAAVTLAT